jgi:hypothetical protein
LKFISDVGTIESVQVRTSVKNKNGKTYRYVQIVKSYRRKPDGMPMHKVVANLGDLPKVTVENLQLAFRASRQGKATVIAPELPGLSDRSLVKANLRFLDVAVMVDMWRSWRLGKLLAGLIEDGQHMMSPADVICALTVQRAVAPGSKLSAKRWFPTTALPELLDVAPKLLTNTRIHRVLEELHARTPELQQRLCELYLQRQRSFASLFLDVTDTYFEGRGCEMAENSRTKAGHKNKRCIGIVLLANEHGYPLRWQVLPGKTKDPQAMGEMVERLSTMTWLKDTPLVCDRAMGTESAIGPMLKNRVHFLTAARVNSIESHTLALPYASFSQFDVQKDETKDPETISQVVAAARKLGLEEVGEDLFIVDLGVVEPEDVVSDEADDSTTEASCKKPKSKGEQLRGLGTQLRFARHLAARLGAGEFPHQKALAHHIGLTPARVSDLLQLLRLAPDIQAALAKCHHSEVGVPIKRLKQAVRSSDHDEQRELLSDVLKHLEQCDSLPSNSKRPKTRPPYRLRLVAYFNPRMFVEQRRRARVHLDKLRRFVEELNEELANTKRSREEQTTRNKILRTLERDQEVELFDLCLTPLKVTTAAGNQLSSFFCELRLKPEVWQRRRRYDGFVLLLGHPELSQSGRELALLYRAKDAVEKNFETIKSTIKLRPIFSYTDPKVEAHVTICMLALLLHRTLEQRLRAGGVHRTAPSTLEAMATCHLNMIRPPSVDALYYSVTETTGEQQELLNAVGLGQLADDRLLSNLIAPRPIS